MNNCGDWTRLTIIEKRQTVYPLEKQGQSRELQTAQPIPTSQDDYGTNSPESHVRAPEEQEGV